MEQCPYGYMSELIKCYIDQEENNTLKFKSARWTLFNKKRSAELSKDTIILNFQSLPAAGIQHHNFYHIPVLMDSSFCCYPCAVAQSRTNLDNSSVYFNALCLTLPIARWLARSAYGIGSRRDYCCDILSTCFCPCCATNQLYQTTLRRGNAIENRGLIDRDWYHVNHSNISCTSYLDACCCPRCFNSDTLLKAFDMPLLLACCFVNPYMFRNLIRYHYRLRPAEWANNCVFDTDLVDDCCVPSSVHCFLEVFEKVYHLLHCADIFCSEYFCHYCLSFSSSYSHSDLGQGSEYCCHHCLKFATYSHSVHGQVLLRSQVDTQKDRNIEFRTRTYLHGI
eukprot:gene10551-14174_t